MRKILFVIKKEFLQIRRDRPMMALIFMVPIVQLLILGYAVSTDVKNVGIAVCDLDKSPLSRDLVDRFRHSKYLRVKVEGRKSDSIAGALEGGKASIGLVLPRNMSKNLSHNAAGSASRSVSVSLQVLLDGQDSNTATVALGYVRGILEGYIQEKLSLAAGAAGEGRGLVVIEPEIRVWFNPELKTSHYMVPGIAVFLLTMITSLISAMGLVREKEIGTLDQLLVSPLKKHELLIGKMIPFAVVGFIELVLAVAFAKAWYGIPIVGNLALFALFAVVFLFTTLGIGLFVSAASQTQQQAMFMTVFLLFFFIIMSGFLFPIENMPKIMRVLSYLDPLRYLMTATRAIFIKGAGLHSLTPQLLALAAFGAVIFPVAMRRFQGRMR
jgi:ABC-2 type transport system permease protein